MPPIDIGAVASPALPEHDLAPDLERRFGGLRRLYGDAGYARLRAARVAVVGLGGVGSWAAEALARSGVAELTLIDLDHVAESNINRQVQALGATLGQAKAQALAARVADIHPGCVVHAVEEFAGPDNWPALLPRPIDALIDACDQVRAKQALAAWALRERVAFVCVGAAGGKQLAHRVEVDDLAGATHDPLARRVAPAPAPAGRRGAQGPDRRALRVLARERACAAGRVRHRGQPQLPRLRIERHGHRDVRLCRGRRGAASVAASATAAGLKIGQKLPL